MMKRNFVSSSATQTRAFAQRYARSLTHGRTFALQGSLGAGKTVFAQGFAQGLGVAGPIASPTFIVMNVYPVKKKKINMFVHVDCYRLESVADVRAIGLEEYMRDLSAVVLIEWADKIPDLLPPDAVWVTLSHRGPRTRAIRIEEKIGARIALRKK